MTGLLTHGMGLHAIRHEGADLSKPDFDRMVKVAASTVAATAICTLHLKPDEERFRFGFSA